MAQSFCSLKDTFVVYRAIQTEQPKLETYNLHLPSLVIFCFPLTSFISPWESSNGLSINTAEQSRVPSHADLYSRCSSISFALSDAHSWSKRSKLQRQDSSLSHPEVPQIEMTWGCLMFMTCSCLSLSWACPRHRAGGPPRRAASHQSRCVTNHRNQKKMEWSCCGTRMCSGLSSTNAGTQHSQRMCVHVLALLSQSGKWTDVVAIFSFRNKMFPGFVCLKSQGLVWNLAVCHTGERRMSFKEVKKTC